MTAVFWIVLVCMRTLGIIPQRSKGLDPKGRIKEKKKTLFDCLSYLIVCGFYDKFDISFSYAGRKSVEKVYFITVHVEARSS